MPTRNVNLTDHDDRFIEDSISAGRFANASEAIRAGLVLLERDEQKQEAKLNALRKAIDEGDASGIAPSGSFDRARDAIKATHRP